MTPRSLAGSRLDNRSKAGKVTITAIDDDAYDNDDSYNSSDDWLQYKVKDSDLD
jgi:hypothetical protein